MEEMRAGSLTMLSTLHNDHKGLQVSPFLYSEKVYKFHLPYHLKM